MMNRGCFKYSFARRLKNLFVLDYIMVYLEEMRKLSYYSKLGAVKVFSWYHQYRYRKLGLQLWFSIGSDCFGYGLVNPHYDTIVVGPTNRIGGYAVLHTCTCITDNSKVIGKGLYLSTGAKMILNLKFGDYISVDANTVVNKSFTSDLMIVGAPAKEIKSALPLWERDGD